MVEEAADLQEVLAFAVPIAQVGGRVPQRVRVDLLGRHAGLDEVALDDAVDHAAADGAVGLQLARDVGQPAGTVGVHGPEDIVPGLDGFEATRHAAGS